MPSILSLLPTTKLGIKPSGYVNYGHNSTLHYMSSLNGNPPFSSYSDPKLKGLHPTQLSMGTLTPKKYLDNLPH